MNENKMPSFIGDEKINAGGRSPVAKNTRPAAVYVGAVLKGGPLWDFATAHLSIMAGFTNHEPLKKGL